MPVITQDQVCWRCGGAQTINRGADRCPGCAGTGRQHRPARPAVAVGYLEVLHRMLEETASTGHPQADEADVSIVTSVRLVPDEMTLGARIFGTAPTASQPCSACGGSGVQTTTVATEDGRYETRQQTCTGCGGSGRVG